MTERRMALRWSGAGVRDIAGRVRAGHDISVIDLSAWGALVAGARPLRPGSLIDVQLARKGDRILVSARVVRCQVVAIDAHDGVRYHAALSFDRRLEWMCEGPTPPAPPVPGRTARWRDAEWSRYPERGDDSSVARGSREND